MTARILDGKKLAADIRAEIAGKAQLFFERTNVRPHLAAVLVGDDPASQRYVRNKQKACEQAGLTSCLRTMPATTTQAELLAVVEQLNADPSVHGILVQLPLPRGLDAEEIILKIDALKDVDCFHPYNVGLVAAGVPRYLPCTPAGVQQILIREGIETAGKHVVVLGRSHMVGRPLATMLSQRGPGADATVTLCHSRTPDLGYFTRQADILIAAVGRPNTVTADMVREGVVVIDVGTNVTPEGKLVGDVDFAPVAAKAAAITPVPGGVGPMTIALLLQNTLTAAVQGDAR